MAALSPDGTGAYAPAEVEVKPRIRVRLHFGGTFAQDGPRQWRYFGGEVYNESFPMDSKYAEVSKRLNDKFGDTVSFKYLCPGDDVDPDNLVQVQGDDDLREMCDEYQNALQKPSTPVKTMRIKVFVFRAVIFEREVQELDEDLVDEDELMTMPEDGEPVSSCDHECGPNWSDWGEPDELEVTESSMPSAHLSSDAELHASSAAAAATSIVSLQNSTSVNSTTSGKTAAQLAFSTPAGAGQAPAGAAGGIVFKRPCAGVGTVEASHGHGAGIPPEDAGTGRPSALGTWKGGCYGGGGFGQGHDEEAEAAAGEPVGGRSGEAAPARTGVGESGQAGSDEKLKLERRGNHGCAAATSEVASGPAAARGHAKDGEPAEYDRPGAQERMADSEGAARNARSEIGEQATGGKRLNQEENIEGNSDRVLSDMLPHSEELQVDGRDREQRERTDVEQEQQQHIEQERRLSPRLELAAQVVVEQQQERQHSLNHSQPAEEEVGAMGFFCEEELEDPYGETYDNGPAPVAGAGLHNVHNKDADATAGRQCDLSSAASDGAVHSQPRAAGVDRGCDVGCEPYPAPPKPGGGGDAGIGGAVKGLLARLPAVVDLLPRHISAFGESSRDESQGTASGACVIGNGHFLPSRITIFGDDAASAGLTGGGGTGLHRLALMGAAGGGLVLFGRGRGMAPSAWPDPGAPPAGTAAAAAAAGIAPHRMGPPGFSMAHVADDLLAGDSRLCITQEFGAKHRSSMIEPEGFDGSRCEAGGGEGGGGGRGGRMSPLDPLDLLDPLLRMGLGGGGLGLGGGLGPDGLLDSLSPSSVHNHPLRGVVKKRKSEVTIMAKIGEGAFGEVSQAQVFPYGIVAVKWLKRERFAKYSESFQREAETLAKLNHPNIIRMYGLVMDTPDTPTFGSGGGATPHGGQNGSGGSGGGCGGGSGTPTGLIGGIITEFVRNGSLGQYLRSMNGRRLSLRQRAMIALQASLGMAYLHEQSPAVVHFDLKPDNLLVDGEGDSMVIKVADFGLSKHKLSNYVSCRDLRGTLPYMAYELVSNAGHISEKVDVYSMGVVMWEMYTGEPPFAHLSAQEILSGLLHGNLHLALPPNCEPEWRSLVETCMDPDPAARPSFQELAMQLQEMLRLERQSSNASSVSVSAAAAAAAAAVLESESDETCGGESGGGVMGAGVQLQGLAAGGHWRLPGLGLPAGGVGTPPPPQPAALLGQGGGAGGGLAADSPAKQMLAQVLQGHSPPPLMQAPPPPPLLVRPQAVPMPPPPQQPPPPLVHQQPQHHHHPLAPLMAAPGPSPPQPPSAPHPGALPPFQLAHQPYRHVQFALAPSPAVQQRQPPLPPTGTQPPQHLVFMRQQLGAPLTNPTLPMPSPALTGHHASPQQPPISFPLQLPPNALFEPAPPQASQLQHMQPMGGLYGLAGGPGVPGPGLALVGWGGDRGGGGV